MIDPKASRELVLLAEDPALLHFFLLASVSIFWALFLSRALVGVGLVLADVKRLNSHIGPFAAVIGAIIIEPLHAEAHATTVVSASAVSVDANRLGLLIDALSVIIAGL